MRVTDSLRTDSLAQNIATGLDNMNTVQGEISTGKRLTQASDDPIGASQSMAWRSVSLDTTQYQRDADQAKSFLTASDGALGDAGNVIQAARQIAVQGANSFQTPDSQIALSQQVNGLIKQLTTVANTQIHGKYLFGGTQTQTPPYAVANPVGADPMPVYGGNSGTMSTTLGPNSTLTINTPGSAVFDGTFQTLQALSANLATGNVPAISANIAALDANLSTNSAVRAAVGSKTNQVDDTTQRLTRAQGEYQSAISKIEDVDLAQAYVQLQSAQNVYQASLVTTSKAFAHSLADYLG